MAGVAPAYVVDGPAPVRSPYGLETVALVIAEVTDRFLGGTNPWLYALGAAVKTIDNCVVVQSPPASKETQHMPGGNAGDPYEPFGVFTGLDCTGFTLTNFDEFERRVQVPMESQEWVVAESELFDSAAGNFSLTDAGTILAGIDHAVIGLGDLEQQWSAAKQSRGVLHMSKRAATVYAHAQVLVERQGVLQTVIGTPVVASAAYDPATPPDAGGGAPAAGHEWIYMTTQIHVRRTALNWLGDDPSQVLERDTNLAEVRTERWYTLTFDHAATTAKQVDLTTL